MKRIGICAIFLLVTTLSCTISKSSPAAAHSDTSVGINNEQAKISGAMKKRPSLDVNVLTDKTSYNQGEIIKLTASLVNMGDEAIFLYSYLSWGYSSSFTLYVTDIADRNIPAEGLDDSIAPPPMPDDKTTLIKLNPHHIFGVTRLLRLDELRINKVGKYKIFVKYHSPISERYGQGLSIWSREMGELKSNILQIEVLPGR